MTKETLKQLIEIEYDRAETISHFKKEIFRLIDLYESDKQLPNQTPGYPFQGNLITVPCGTMPIPDEVPYGEICPCNPKNGGNGICGCIMGNKMVQNPKKYGITTTSTNININPDSVQL